MLVVLDAPAASMPRSHRKGVRRPRSTVARQEMRKVRTHPRYAATAAAAAADGSVYGGLCGPARVA